MKVAVIRFPGSNCDQDALHALRDDVGVGAEYVWHQDTSLAGFDALFLPGGFSYGDYLRCGAIAARAPIMDEVVRFARDGRLVIAVCNGFQVACEVGLLPGALLLNEKQKFLCRDVYLRAENTTSPWTHSIKSCLKLPIAHGEGRFICDDETLARIEGNGQVAFRYVNSKGEIDQESNPNGSKSAIAGVLNEKGNVLGLMPHPERVTKSLLGGTDGLSILNALKLVRV